MLLCAFLPAYCWLFILKSYCVVGKYLSLLHLSVPIFASFGLPGKWVSLWLSRQGFLFVKS